LLAASKKAAKSRKVNCQLADVSAQSISHFTLHETHSSTFLKRETRVTQKECEAEEMSQM
jgi:hypothetical protein